MIFCRLLYASNCFIPALSLSLLSRLTKLSKSAMRAIFRLPRRSHTGPLFQRLGLPSLHHAYLQKVIVFVYRTLTSHSSILFKNYFQVLSRRDLPLDARVVTRGQQIRLLRIPFLPGPSGRHTLQFFGNHLWNLLPNHVRQQVNLSNLKHELLDLDLPSLL